MWLYGCAECWETKHVISLSESADVKQLHTQRMVVNQMRTKSLPVIVIFQDFDSYFITFSTSMLCSLIYNNPFFRDIFFLTMFICLSGKIYLAPSSEMSNIRPTFNLLWLSFWGQHYKSSQINKTNYFENTQRRQHRDTKKKKGKRTNQMVRQKVQLWLFKKSFFFSVLKMGWVI